MKKIKVGEYIRFYMGSIVKCTEWDVNHYNDFLKGKFHLCIDNEEEKIMKHSFNIIDLIEVGDYVNGKLIHYVLKKPKKRRNYDLLWQRKTF